MPPAHGRDGYAADRTWGRPESGTPVRLRPRPLASQHDPTGSALRVASAAGCSRPTVLSRRVDCARTHESPGGPGRSCSSARPLGDPTTARTLAPTIGFRPSRRPTWGRGGGHDPSLKTGPAYVPSSWPGTGVGARPAGHEQNRSTTSGPPTSGAQITPPTSPHYACPVTGRRLDAKLRPHGLSESAPPRVILDCADSRHEQTK